MKKQNLLILWGTSLSVLVACMVLTQCFRWLHHVNPQVHTVDISGDYIDPVEAKEMQIKDSLKYDPNRNYYILNQYQVTVTQGFFPLLETDSVLLNTERKSRER